METSLRFAFVAVLAVLAVLGPPAHAAEPTPRSALVGVEIGEPPWSAVGRINNSAYGRCSAILVRPDIALTAAHCLYNIASRRFLQPASIHILFGFSKGRYGFHTTAADITIPKDYVPGGLAASARHDWAIVRLSKAAPGNFVPLVVAGPDDPAPSSVRAAGFGQERSEVLTSIGPCSVESAPGDALLVTDCRLSHGFSGGPVIDVATGRLVAISVASAAKGERAFGLAVPVSAVSIALARPGPGGLAPGPAAAGLPPDQP